MTLHIWHKIEAFHRPSDITTVGYLNEIERLQNGIKRHEMELPTGALAYCVLKMLIYQAQSKNFIQQH